jgi:hypothetical protein
MTPTPTSTPTPPPISPPTGGPPPSGSPSAPPGSCAAARRKLIAEYLQDSIEYAEPARAVLRALDADLMQTATDLSRLLLDRPPRSVAALEEVNQILDPLLRILRQLERFARLSARPAPPVALPPEDPAVSFRRYFADRLEQVYGKTPPADSDGPPRTA